MLGGDSDTSIYSDSDDEIPIVNCDGFDSTVCLFCRDAQFTLKSNLEHMSKCHGLVIHSPESLLVDEETLLSYLFLIINGYHECILCGTRRGNAHAIRCHMLDKSHCHFKITPDSEYADFYSSQDDKDGESPLSMDDMQPRLASDEGTLSLSTGKIIAHRSTPSPKHHRLIKQQQRAKKTIVLDTDASSVALISVSPNVLAKVDKRAASQILTLREADQRTIAHLTSAEQRVTVRRRDKEIQSARRADRRLRARVEALNNMNLRHHYQITDDDGRLHR